MTAVHPDVQAFRVSRKMSFEQLVERCRQVGAVFSKGGTEWFRIADHMPAGAMHPHDYDQNGLRRFCLNRMS